MYYSGVDDDSKKRKQNNEAETGLSCMFLSVAVFFSLKCPCVLYHASC